MPKTGAERLRAHRAGTTSRLITLEQMLREIQERLAASREEQEQLREMLAKAIERATAKDAA